MVVKQYPTLKMKMTTTGKNKTVKMTRNMMVATTMRSKISVVIMMKNKMTIKRTTKTQRVMTGKTAARVRIPRMMTIKDNDLANRMRTKTMDLMQNSKSSSVVVVLQNPYQ